MNVINGVTHDVHWRLAGPHATIGTCTCGHTYEPYRSGDIIAAVRAAGAHLAHLDAVRVAVRAEEDARAS